MKHIISGIQPTGAITLGNYIGAIKNFVRLQEEYPDHQFLIFIADLHAITIPQDRQKLRNNIRSLAALYLACGLRRERIKLFIQSEVPTHNQLGYIFECIGPIGDFERMTQYKDKKQRQVSGVSLGLLTYPALMAADILLYDAEYVPIGDDQKQHLELARDLAIRFNNRFGETFQIPEPIITRLGARIMALQEPTKKMSKSDDNPKNIILLLDDLAVTKNKIKGAITDLDGGVRYHPEEKPGVSNLITIYASISNLSINEIEAKYQNAGYQEFKEDLAKIVCEEIQKIQERYQTILQSKELDEILDEGRDYAFAYSVKKIAKVYQKVGLGRKK